MVESVVALVLSGHDDRNHLSLGATERASASHELSVQLVVVLHRATVNPMNPDDVVSVRNAIRLGNIVLGHICDKGH
jgi:hypothetical protein